MIVGRVVTPQLSHRAPKISRWMAVLANAAATIGAMKTPQSIYD